MITVLKGLDGLKKLSGVNLENNKIYKSVEQKSLVSLLYLDLTGNNLPESFNKLYESEGVRIII